MDLKLIVVAWLMFYLNVVGYKVCNISPFRLANYLFYLNVVGYKERKRLSVWAAIAQFYLNVVGYKDVDGQMADYKGKGYI